VAQRSLNKVQLIGNLTRDPELRYTPQGTAVCTFGLATNRQWTTEAGDRKEEAEFHRIVAWNKLAELCAQLLFKGRRIFVEGRLQTRQWTGQDGAPRQTTEIVISDMIILDSKRAPEVETTVVPEESAEAAKEAAPAEAPAEPQAEEKKKTQTKAEKEAEPEKAGKKKEKAAESAKAEEQPAAEGEEKVNPEDIPF